MFAKISIIANASRFNWSSRTLWSRVWRVTISPAFSPGPCLLLKIFHPRSLYPIGFVTSQLLRIPLNLLPSLFKAKRTGPLGVLSTGYGLIVGGFTSLILGPPSGVFRNIWSTSASIFSQALVPGFISGNLFTGVVPPFPWVAIIAASLKSWIFLSLIWSAVYSPSFPLGFAPLFSSLTTASESEILTCDSFIKKFSEPVLKNSSVVMFFFPSAPFPLALVSIDMVTTDPSANLIAV